MCILYIKKICDFIMKNEFALIIPTKNRPNCIETYLNNKASTLKYLNIDILIVDSSTNLETSNVVKKFCEFYDNISYNIYIEEQETLSIDDKVFEICKRYINNYKYILFSSDRVIINIENIYNDVIFLFENQIDFIIYDNGKKDLKYYNDSKALLKEWGWRTTSLSSIIFSSEFLKSAMNCFSPSNNKSRGLWLMSTVFFLISDKKFKSAVLCEKDIWTQNMNGEESFWIISKNVLLQWGKIWCDVIDEYPDFYDSIKNEVILSHSKKTHIFSFKGLLRMKITNNLKLKNVIKYAEYIKRVTKMNLFIFFTLSILPIRSILKISRKIYLKIKN